jgi:hypothetical protein
MQRGSISTHSDNTAAVALQLVPAGPIVHAKQLILLRNRKCQLAESDPCIHQSPITLTCMPINFSILLNISSPTRETS